MWDSPLDAVNMFYYHWLIKKMLWPMSEQNIAKWEIQAEIRGGKKSVRYHVAAKGERHQNLTTASW